MSVHSAVVVCTGGVRIVYIRRALTGSSSLDATPVTGSLLFYATVCCLAVCCAAEFSSWVLFGGIDCIWLAGRGLFFRQVSVTLVMATDSAAAAGGQAGITFGVELVVPWDAPESQFCYMFTPDSGDSLTGLPSGQVSRTVPLSPRIH